MLERSPFKVEQEVSRWLNSVGIEPHSKRSKNVFPIYERATFERVIPLMPSALEDVGIEKRASKRVPTEVKRKAVEEVKKGLAPYFVSRRLGVSAKAVTKWVADYDKHGDVQPASKLEGYEGYIRSAIEANPTVGISALRRASKKDGIGVGDETISKFIADLGYERDGEGRLIAKGQTTQSAK
jgi:transposase-like protein